MRKKCDIDDVVEVIVNNDFVFERIWIWFDENIKRNKSVTDNNINLYITKIVDKM